MQPARTRVRRARSPGGNHLLLMVLVLSAVGALAAAGSQLEDGRGAGGGAASPERKAGRSPGRTLTVGWAARPASLDPALAGDRTSMNLAWNLMDPLVKLGDDLAPVPNLARGWEVADGGRKITFALGEDGRWTNGDPLTAHDFEYAWKRALSPALGSPFASRLFALKGASAYHACVGAACPALADRVGVKAVADYELVVTLSAPQPWFVAQTAHPVFLPVHRATVERYGDDWTNPRNIVTSGPFLLAGSDPDSVTLAKNASWRDADAVALGRVENRVIPDDAARVQAFDAGEVATLDGSALPGADLPALRERREYEVYPALDTYFYAFNLASVPDVHQRRAMSLAIDRSALIENVVQADRLPATRFTPAAAPDYGAPDPPSPWLPPEGDLDAAREELDAAAAVKRTVTLLHVDAPGNRAIAIAVADAWRELGLETTIRAQRANEYLDFRGPLSPDSVDVYQMDWSQAVPDAIGGLRLLTCRTDRNKTNFCNAGFDDLIARARREREAAIRGQLYARAEEILAGERGSLPVLPLFWGTYPNLEALSARDSFTINPLGQIDLAAVEVR